MALLRIKSPIGGTLIEVLVSDGESVANGQVIAIVEAMKMEHEICTPNSGQVLQCFVKKGDLIRADEPLFEVAAQDQEVESIPTTAASAALKRSEDTNTAIPRPELVAMQSRIAMTLDQARPQAVQKRHALTLRTARENLMDLCDPDSFVEFGALTFAAQEQRRSKEDLIANTPADGLVAGLAKVNGVQCAVMAYDATVLAGTQGFRNHQKTDRLLGIAKAQLLPVVLFAEGGGGRPGDVDMPIVAGLHITAFAKLAKLAGVVPLIGIAAGRCFAGNAALFACCDVRIACASANIGMGGPAMIQGGGLGQFSPEQIGPAIEQSTNGVIDFLADDEAHAVTLTKALLALMTSKKIPKATAADQVVLREAVPRNRLRSYNIKNIVLTVLDHDSMLEVKRDFGLSVVTMLGRIGGLAIGVIANNPVYLGGAIDPNAASKLTDFLRYCERYDCPIVSLIDTPGFMVGPSIEAQGQVRFAGQLFIQTAKLSQKFVAVVVRKGYGLGAMAMAAGGFHETTATLAWPTAEFGAMGLEGAVRLGYKKELEAITDPAQRELLFAKLLSEQIEQGGALRMAETLEIDAIIDPADTRETLIKLLVN